MQHLKMSKPFIQIVDDKLQLVGQLPDGNPRVISIMGKARMGKSTFLNAIVSHLTKQSAAPFKAQDSDEHCTRGIDSYYLASHNLLLLDSQGLDYEDASHDPLLLLFLYLVSDLIIFNENRRLENGALKLLEPICAFTNYLDIDTVMKPKLYFRIFDSDVKDAQKNLEKVMGTYNDQYQSIRNSIKHLFDPDLKLIKTEALDRPAKMMLDHEMYTDLLAETSIGFSKAIQQILQGAESMTKKTLLDKIPELVHKINTNQEITIEKLDVVKLQAENDIHKWIQDMIPSEMYAPISVTGTQTSYDEQVEPRKQKKKQILAAFTKRFKDVDETIRGPFYKDISEKMMKPIEAATNESIAKASILIQTPFKTAKSHHFQEINSLVNAFSTLPDFPFYLKQYLSSFTQLEIALQDVYEVVRTNMTTWIQDVRKQVTSTIKLVQMVEKEEQNKLCELCASTLMDFDSWCTDQIRGKMDNAMVTKRNSTLLNELLQQKMTELQEKASTLFVRRSITFALDSQSNNLTPTIKAISNSQACMIQNYDIARTVLDETKDKLETLLHSPSFETAKILNEEKETYLFGTILPKTPWTMAMIAANPEINFVEDSIAGTFLTNPSAIIDECILTNRTHKDTCGALYDKVLKRLVAKNYMKEEDSSSLLYTIPKGNIVSLGLNRNSDRYRKSLLYLFEHNLHKVFCQEVCSGLFFVDMASPKKTVRFAC